MKRDVIPTPIARRSRGKPAISPKGFSSLDVSLGSVALDPPEELPELELELELDEELVVEIPPVNRISIE